MTTFLKWLFSMRMICRDLNAVTKFVSHRFEQANACQTLSDYENLCGK